MFCRATKLENRFLPTCVLSSTHTLERMPVGTHGFSLRERESTHNYTAIQLLLSMRELHSDLFYLQHCYSMNDSAQIIPQTPPQHCNFRNVENIMYSCVPSAGGLPRFLNNVRAWLSSQRIAICRHKLRIHKVDFYW